MDSLSTKIHYGYTAKTAKEKIGPKYLRITDIQNNVVNWGSVPYCQISSEKIPKFLLYSNDLIFARTGATVGKSFLVKNPPKSVFASYLIRIILSTKISAKYVEYFFKSGLYWKQIRSKSVGIAQPNFNANKLSKIQILLPPLNEQKRIVSKIELIFAQIDTKQRELEDLALQIRSVPDSFAELKNSILKKAFEGRLVPQNPQDESAKVLLKEIYKNLEKDLIFEKSDNLPKDWINLRLQSCVEILDSKRIPINASQREQRQGRVPYYGSTGQIGWIDDYLFDKELVLLGEDGAPFLDIFKDKAYLVSGKSWVNNHAHVLCGLKNLLLNKFLCYFLNQFNYRDYLTGTTRLKLTQAHMKMILVLLPPLNEQKRIVSKIESIFAQIDTKQRELEDLALQIRSVSDSFAELKNSILKKAFEGRLVPQDPQDEPASGLLEKIKQKSKDRRK